MTATEIAAVPVSDLEHRVQLRRAAILRRIDRRQGGVWKGLRAALTTA